MPGFGRAERRNMPKRQFTEEFKKKTIKNMIRCKLTTKEAAQTEIKIDTETTKEETSKEQTEEETSQEETTEAEKAQKEEAEDSLPEAYHHRMSVR